MTVRRSPAKTAGSRKSAARKKKAAPRKKAAAGKKKAAAGRKKAAKKKAVARKKSAPRKKAAAGKKAAASPPPRRRPAAVRSEAAGRGGAAQAGARSARPKGSVSAAQVTLGHVFAIKPRINTSFRPNDFVEAKRRLRDDPFESLQEAARAVAAEALSITRGAAARPEVKRR